MAALKGWKLQERKIVRTFEFPTFRDAIAFVNRVAEVAEDLNHHPVITIVWKTVKLSSTSFDVGRLTERDFRLARRIDALL